MSDIVLFQMAPGFRQSLIDRHLFYVGQAGTRLLSQFGTIEADADRAAREWLERHARYFDPDRHDASDFFDGAHDAAAEFYSLLSDMREQTRLSVVAGIFHEWDKQLREWLVREIGHWHVGLNAGVKVWKADFEQIAALLESFDWSVRTESYFGALDACRLVVNVYKHGQGPSLDQLKKRHPEYLNDSRSKSNILSKLSYLNHTDLRVSEEQVEAFSSAVTTFWRRVPENVYASGISDLPDWFTKAIVSDRDSQKQAIRK